MQELSKKAQYAFEFLIVFALLTFIFLVWLTMYVNLRMDLQTDNSEKTIQTYGSDLSDKLYVAAQVNPGYYDEISIKNNFNGMTFDAISLRKNELYLTAKGKNYYFDTPCVWVDNCDYDSVSQTYKLTGGPLAEKTLEIENQNFEVYINKKGGCGLPVCSSSDTANCIHLCS